MENEVKQDDDPKITLPRYTKNGNIIMYYTEWCEGHKNPRTGEIMMEEQHDTRSYGEMYQGFSPCTMVYSYLFISKLAAWTTIFLFCTSAINFPFDAMWTQTTTMFSLVGFMMMNVYRTLDPNHKGNI